MTVAQWVKGRFDSRLCEQYLTTEDFLAYVFTCQIKYCASPKINKFRAFGGSKNDKNVSQLMFLSTSVLIKYQFNNQNRLTAH